MIQGYEISCSRIINSLLVTNMQLNIYIMYISIYITNVSSCNVTINCIVDYPVHCVSEMYIMCSVYILTEWRDTIISGSQEEMDQHC